MGGQGSGRKPSEKSIVERYTPVASARGNDVILPNYSGVKSEALKTSDTDITGGGSGSGHTIQEEGSDLSQRTNLNFSGSAVTAVDDSGNDATVINITASGSGDNLGNHIATQTISGSAVMMTGKISGSSYVDSAIDHDSLTNTHNLTTDINHDNLTGFVANEHIDWTSTTSDISADNISGANIFSLNTISGAALHRTSDQSLSGASYVPNIVYTEGAEPTASNYTVGTLLAIYTP